MRRRGFISSIVGLAAFFPATLAGSIDTRLSARDDNNTADAYEELVCHPATSSPSDTVPPCTEIENIQAECALNGTEPLNFLAHAECMCGGSFFIDWPACQKCLFVHGLRTERDLEFYGSVISSVSQELCTGTPTADFVTLFDSVVATVASPTTGAAVLSDQFPSQAAVSLYFTATGHEGPGAITGSATLATATGPTIATQTGTSSPTGSGAFQPGPAATTSSSKGAAPTDIPDSKVGVAAMVLGALLAAL